MHDQSLERLRNICLQLPGATEVEKWGHPIFVAHGLIFVAMGFSESYPFAFSFKPAEAKVETYVNDDRVISARHYDAGAWLGFDLSVRPVDWKEVSEIVRSSYELVV